MSFQKLLLDGILGFHVKIDRTELENGILISTVNTSDQGPETAIVDKKSAYPVERYASVEAAQTGHANWVERAKAMKAGDVIVMLGYDQDIPEQKITLAL